MPPKSDEGTLLDIIKAADSAISFMGKMSQKDFDQVWKTIKEDLPPLLESLRKLAPRKR